MSDVPTAKSCAACRGELPRLTGDRLAPYRRERPDGWEIVGIAWGQLDVRLHTFKVEGLTETDFVLARLIETAWAARSEKRSSQ